MLIAKKAEMILTLKGAARKEGRRVLEEDLGILKKASIVCRKGKIEWIGPHSKLPKEYARKNAKEVNCEGQTILPGFIECHTHLVFAGDRAAEFELRNTGTSYQEIAARGGGILSTMKAVRKISPAQLLKDSQKRVNEFLRQGVTTLEIKSGYGLNLPAEVKTLEVAGRLKGPRILRTFLGAHALPPEYSSYEEYLEILANQVLPTIKKRKLAERVDIFIEKGFFPREASEKYLQRARDLGFQITVHADQLSLSGGTTTAIKIGAQSADHVIQLEENEIQALAKTQTTAVLLPAADLYMRCAYPKARSMIDAGVRVALATDFNPGSSPTQDLSLVGLLARLEMKMTLPEVIAAYTVGAAFALGQQKITGSLQLGYAADFVCTENDWRTLFYSAGARPVVQMVSAGKLKNLTRLY